MTNSPTKPLPDYCYPKQYEQVMKHVADHEMTVLHEEGNYRHLRFKNPHRSMWFFDIITWPGALVIRGDIGRGLLFSRVPNMLAFFDNGQPDGHINPGYWAEKLDQGRHSVFGYSEDAFHQYVKAQTEEFVKDAELGGTEAAALRRIVEMDVLYFSYNEDEAITALTNFKWQGEHLVEDFEPSFVYDYDHHFLLACHAILWGVKKYHALRGNAGTGER